MSSGGIVQVDNFLPHHIIHLLTYNLLSRAQKKFSTISRYHQTLCLKSRSDPGSDNHPLVRLNETWKQMHYPPETATIMLLARMVSLIEQSSDQQAALFTFAQFCRRTVNDTQEITHNLLGEKYGGQIDVLREMALAALNTESVPHVRLHNKALGIKITIANIISVVHSRRI